MSIETGLGGPVIALFLVFFSGLLSFVAARFHKTKPDFDFGGVSFDFRRRYICGVAVVAVILAMALLGFRLWLLVSLGLLILGMFAEFLKSTVQSLDDARTSRTPFETLRAVLGWTEAHRIASGAKEPSMSFAMFIGIHALIALFLASAIQEFM